ncbi:thioredoxin-like protein [Colletotrichum tofieldiae]|nr:thioredoxin-like protein [Colletotrichum tofieldiae]
MVVLQATSLTEFNNLLSANTYVAVDFYADWCGPCHAIKPIYESLSNTHGQPGSLAFVKVNVDAAQDIARRYNVTAMPTFMFFENGQPFNGAGASTLQATVQELGGLARKRAAEATAKKAEAERRKEAAAEKKDRPDDGSTVSGGYTLGGNTGARSDWKMSLRG